MRKRLLRASLACALTLACAQRAAAITWFEQEVTCPVCQTKNVFLVPGSWGSYIYQYPSKFELIFWPHTDHPSYHSCRKCKLTAFMGDFERVPKEKHAEVRKRLAGLKLEPRRGGESMTKYYKGAAYLDIPLTDRLLAARQVYEVLGRDDEFWCHFERVLGHHYADEKRAAEADEARRRALRLAEKMLADPARAAERKEFLYIAGAMRHLLGDDAAALRDFREAEGLKYRHKDLKPEQSENYDRFLSDLLRQYFEKLKAAPAGGRAASLGGAGACEFLAPLRAGLLYCETALND
jgi:hypothetical protein